MKGMMRKAEHLCTLSAALWRCNGRESQRTCCGGQSLCQSRSLDVWLSAWSATVQWCAHGAGTQISLLLFSEPLESSGTIQLNITASPCDAWQAERSSNYNADWSSAPAPSPLPTVRRCRMLSDCSIKGPLEECPSPAAQAAPPLQTAGTAAAGHLGACCIHARQCFRVIQTQNLRSVEETLQERTGTSDEKA